MNHDRFYLPNLDLLRFLAALYVVVAHYGYIGPNWGVTGYAPPGGFIAGILENGTIGVPIFFALSGFLIAYVSEKKDGVSFATNRIFRLMPGFWASMTITFIVISILGSMHEVSFLTWVTNLTLVPQVMGQPFMDGVYWTLFFEFVFYGWATIFIFFGVFHRHILLISAAWLALIALNFFIIKSGALKYLFITDYGSAFIAGMVFWHIAKNGISVLAFLLLALSSIQLAFAWQATSDYLFFITPPVLPSYTESVMLSTAAIAIVGVGIFGPQIKFGTRFLYTLGGLSYPLYLMHQEIGYAVFRHLSNWQMPLIIAICMTGLMIFVAYVVHRFCEKPLRKFMQHHLQPSVDWLAKNVNKHNPFAAPKATSRKM